MNRLKFSANLGFLWPEHSLPERIHAAARAGFGAVECHWPYDTEPAKILAALNETGLVMLALNTPPGNPNAGDFGLGAVPGRETEAREGVCRAIDYAGKIGAQHIHVMAGICEDSCSALDRMYNHLVWAAEVARSAGIDLWLEPMNRIDRPGYALFQTSQAIDLIHRLEYQEGLCNIRLLFDCYHVQMMEGNLLARLTESLPWVGHIQVAGVPGRHEPTDCEIDYGWLLGRIAQLNYTGWVGAEYQPARGTDEGLEWFRPFRSGPVPKPTSPRVFRHYSQRELDAEYNNRAKVTDFGGHLAWYRTRSKETRLALDGIQDIGYGPSSAETLDIFWTGDHSAQAVPKPIHVFFHGGYWQTLSKNEFSYVANATERLDALCVVVNYALIPQVNMSELVAQCQRALVWLWHHAAAYGGDPSRIFLSGHSAGGHLVAMMAATDWPARSIHCPQDLVKGGLSISGLMDLEPIRLCYLNEELGFTQETIRGYSPIHLANQSDTELHCVYGEREGEEYRRQSETLAARWDGAFSHPLPDQDHFSIVRLLDERKSPVAKILHSMMMKS